MRGGGDGVSYGESVRGGVAKEAAIGAEGATVGDEDWGPGTAERGREGARDERNAVGDGSGKRLPQSGAPRASQRSGEMGEPRYVLMTCPAGSAR